MSAIVVSKTTTPLVNAIEREKDIVLEKPQVKTLGDYIPHNTSNLILFKFLNFFLVKSIPVKLVTRAKAFTNEELKEKINEVIAPHKEEIKEHRQKIQAQEKTIKSLEKRVQVQEETIKSMQDLIAKQKEEFKSAISVMQQELKKSKDAFNVMEENFAKIRGPSLGEEQIRKLGK